MHVGEVDIDVDLVRALVTGQFPELADQPIVEVRSTGTVNAIYRIGDQLYARLPRVAHWVAGSGPGVAVAASARSPAVPADSRTGRAGSARGAYPFPWAIYRWLEGEPYTDGLVDDETQAARDLARFVVELRGIDPVGAPRGGRKPLRELDRDTRQVIEAARGVLDADAALAAWQRSSKLRPGTGRRSGSTRPAAAQRAGDRRPDQRGDRLRRGRGRRSRVRCDRRLERVRPGRAGGFSRCSGRRRRHLAPRPGYRSPSGGGDHPVLRRDPIRGSSRWLSARSGRSSPIES